MKISTKVLSFILVVSIILSYLPVTTFAAALKIVAIKDLSASVYINQSYTLPSMVDAMMSNKTTQKVAVTWNSKTVVTSKAGIFTYKGTVKGYDKQVLLALKVLQTPDAEILRAISYGLVPQALQRNYDKSVTYAEFCGMLSRLIQKAAPERFSEWKRTASKALASQKVMQRDDAAVALLYASKAMGNLYTNVTDYPEIKKIQANKDSWNFKDTFPLWPAWQKDYRMRTTIPGTVDSYENNSWGPVMNTAMWFVLMRLSQVNEKPLLDWDKNYNMRFYDNLTRGEAITAVLRLGESEANLLDKNQYLSVYDVGAYDKTIIPDALLNQPSHMPEPTQSALPSGWKGAGISARKDGRQNYKEFQESDIAFLAENGFNFTRVFFGFSTLRYPDYPADEKLINQSELEDLDRLIAWGIRYGVHIQLSMIGTPDGKESFDITDEEWEMTRAYWQGLAKRYAAIPSRYLSFDLVNEIFPHEESNFDRAVAWMTRINIDIHAASPQRVTLVSHPGNPKLEWVEAMAKAGIAIGCHPYMPTYLADGNDQYLYQKAEAFWPYPYFPEVVRPGEALTITGDIGGNTLQMDFWVYEPFMILYDNGQKQTVQVQGDYKDEMSCGWRFRKPLAIAVPAGVKSMTIQAQQNAFTLCELGFTDKAGQVRWIVPHDFFEASATGGADLTWQTDKGWGSEKVCTAEDVFTQKIQPLLSLAKTNNVGIMCNEFGIFACNTDGWKVTTIAAYYEDMLKMFEQHGIPWCLCETEGFPYRFLTMPVATDKTYEWVGATLTPHTYTFPDGHSRKIYVCEELLNVFRKHISK